MTCLTIYNHGTTDDDSKLNHTTTMLSTATSSDKLVTQGLGSPMKVKAGKFLETELAGSLFGQGIDENVNKLVDTIAAAHNLNHYSVINLFGYSRGAVTCFKQANRLFRVNNGAMQNIPVRIFAVDPVPGNTGCLNSHMWKHLTLKDNVMECTIILAETERRKTFRPVFPAKFFEQGYASTRLWDKLPGNHAGIVLARGDDDPLGDSQKIVFDRAKQFLTGKYLGGWAGRPALLTQLQADDRWFMSKVETLGRYARIMMHFDEYIAMGRKGALGDGTAEWLFGGVGSFGESGAKGGLSPLEKNRHVREKTTPNSFRFKNRYHAGDTKLVSVRFGPSRFFANNHHRELFKEHLLNTTNNLERLEASSSDATARFAMKTTVVKDEITRFGDTYTGKYGKMVMSQLLKYLSLIGA